MRPRFVTIVVVLLMGMFVFVSSTTAQVETKVSQGFNVRGTGWRKVLRSGTPVTVFAYKHKGDVYSFGIYSDDYSGIIDLKIYPFEIEEKQLKKLPDAQGKKASQELMTYYNKACARAREKAFAGKYKTTSPDMFVSGWGGYSVSKDEPITIIGYKETKDYAGPTQYLAIIKNDDARVYHTLGTIEHTIDFPLYYLPSTDDPQVKAILDKEKAVIVKKQQEKERKIEEEKKAQAEKEREEKLRMEAEYQAYRDSIAAAKVEEGYG